MNIDLKQIQALLRLLEKRDVTEFEFEDEHVRLRLVRGVMVAREPGSRIVVSSPSEHPDALTTDVDDTQFEYVTSPFVGTYYGSPSPGNPPFVRVGSAVTPGQTLCIIEAMKLMNEIEVERSGTISEILVEDGKPVEFGQKLFRVKKA